MTTLYSARWVLPISSAPVPDGAIAVAGEHIIAVGQRTAIVAQFSEATVHDFGEAFGLSDDAHVDCAANTTHPHDRGCQRCPETPVNDVLNSDTAGGTK